MLKKVLFILYISIFINSIYSTDNRNTYHVDGYVYDDNGNPLQGVSISFYDLMNPDEPIFEDNTISDDNGYYEIDIRPAFYLIEWTKDAYVPIDISFALGDDTTFEPTVMSSGEVLIVSGQVSGVWTNDYQYWVDGEIYIDDADILVIEEGVTVKFYKDSIMKCYGPLIVDGSDENHVLFTSKEGESIPGDWQNVELFSENNEITYLDYEYATNGFTGTGVSYSIFSNIHIDNLKLNADGFKFSGNESGNLNSTDINHSLTFENNTITITGSYGIFISESDGNPNMFTGNNITKAEDCGIFIYNADGSIFIDNNIVSESCGIELDDSSNSIIDNNNISSENLGIRMINCSYSYVENNTILNPENSNGINTGILSDNSNEIIFSNNNITARYNGINSSYSNDLVINENFLTGQLAYSAIDFHNSQNSNISYNVIERSSCSDNPPSSMRLLNGQSASNSSIQNNNINFYVEDCIYGAGTFKIIEIDNSTIEYNNIIAHIGLPYGGVQSVVYDHGNSSILNNNFTIYEGSNSTWPYNGFVIDSGSIETDDDNFNQLISGNTFEIINYGNNVQCECQGCFWKGDGMKFIINIERGIVSDNTITAQDGTTEGFIRIASSMNSIIENNFIQGSIYHSGNIFSVYSNSTIRNNTVLSGLYTIQCYNYTMPNGNFAFLENVDNVEILNNYLDISSGPSNGKGFFISNSNASIHHNVIKVSNDAIISYEESSGEYYNNTIISNGNGTALSISNLTDVPFYNNIVSGFNTGISASHTLAPIQMYRYNNFYNITTLIYDVSPSVPLLGDYVSITNNGNEEDVINGSEYYIDIYGNMNLDPYFALPNESNYELQIISPCIDNGSPTITDPDGTISDMGAFYKDVNIVEDVYGCMDQTACNYNNLATLDNNNCNYPQIWFLDLDNDGLGFIDSTEESCTQPQGFVSNSDDLEPNCSTNNTDDCGVCSGGNLDKDCNGDCYGIAILDVCGVCSGGNTDHIADSDVDCNGDCFGVAYLDGCSECVGGNTSEIPCLEDCNGVFGGTATWDDCGICNGENLFQDCAGICYGDSIIDSFDECCLPADVDECGSCNGNGWDLCDFDLDGISNFDQYGYGAWGLSVNDIPNDQGGRVYLTFNKSFFDTDSLIRSLESYTIERLDSINGNQQWVNVGNGAAYASSSYIYEASTLSNQTNSNQSISTFRVIAAMDEGNFVSSQAQGFSIDNIAPEVPYGLDGFIDNSQSVLSWDISNDYDFAYFEVYRNDEILTAVIENSYIDTNPEFPAKYNLYALDVNENRSDISESITLYLEELLGDLTNDSTVNILDIVLLVDVVLNVFEYDYSPSDAEMQAADIYEDGQLNVIDIVGLVNIVLNN